MHKIYKIISLLTISLITQLGHSQNANVWRDLYKATKAKNEIEGEPKLTFGTMGHRFLALATSNDGTTLPMQFYLGKRDKFEKTITNINLSPAAVHCQNDLDAFICLGIDDVTITRVIPIDGDILKAIQLYAKDEINKVHNLTISAAKAEVMQGRLTPRINVENQRHPFEWGGEYETVENAQSFLESINFSFRSHLPDVPNLGSANNYWTISKEPLYFKTLKRCHSIATVDSRHAIHENHDFWAAANIEMESWYRWQQPIDWGKVTEIDTSDKMNNAFYLIGTYPYDFTGGLEYKSGWNPTLMTANANRFNPKKYNITKYAITLSQSPSLSARVRYAVIFLNLMCK